MDGVSLARNKSRQFLISLPLAWIEPMLLLGSGVLAVVLHQSFRFPLSLPGRHGIEWIALLVMGRAASSNRAAGSLASISAAGTSMLPIWGYDDPYRWLIYLLPGIVMDAVVYWLPRYRSSLWLLVLLGGFAHATKPLARWLIGLVSGWAYGSLLYGVVYPLATHMMFGMIGGLLGALIVITGKRWLDHC